MNTHRAIIETSVPPTLLLIAAGDQDFCEKQLADWMAKRRPHGLDEFEFGLIVKVEREIGDGR
jgi:hypothetical protein